MKRIIPLLLCGGILGILASPAVAQQTCSITDFQTRSVGQLSELQLLSIYANLSDEQYDKRKSASSASGSLDILSLSSSNSDLKERVRQRREEFRLANYQRYDRTWSETSLDATGLRGYQDCLSASRGFVVTATEASGRLIRLVIDYRPMPDQSLANPVTLISARNITEASLAQALSIVGTQPWLTTPKHLEIDLVRTDPRAESSVTVSTGNLVYAFDVPGEIQVPPVPTRRNLSILWVGDTPSAYPNFLASLRADGHDVAEVTTARSALDFQANNGDRYQVIVSERGLGQGTEAGIQLVRSLRAQGTACPTYLISNSWPNNTSQQATAAGSSGQFLVANRQSLRVQLAELGRQSNRETCRG